MSVYNLMLFDCYSMLHLSHSVNPLFGMPLFAIGISLEIGIVHYRDRVLAPDVVSLY